MSEPDLGAIVGEFGVTPAAIERIPSGLINRTFRVEGSQGDRFVLQAVNPIFAPEVNEDIDALTRHLAGKGHVTPLMRRTRGDRLWIDVEGAVWRMMTFVDGVTRDVARHPADAEQAGRALGRFHGAVADFGHVFRARRIGVHDTPRHLRALREAIHAHADHPLFVRVQPVAEAILNLADGLPALPAPVERVVHGDPKISNVLFDAASDDAICLIDLDTVGPMAVELELGDAFRSWCNTSRHGEDDAEPTFSGAMFEAAVRGYASEAGGMLRPETRGALVAATQTIIIELSARFAADALNESYFGWDQGRFSRAGEHNLLRATGQLALARSLDQQTDQAGAIVDAAFVG